MRSVPSASSLPIAATSARVWRTVLMPCAFHSVLCNGEHQRSVERSYFTTLAPCLDPLLVKHVALAGLHNHDNDSIGERHLKPATISDTQLFRQI